MENTKKVEGKFCTSPFEFAVINGKPDFPVLVCCWVHKSIGSVGEKTKLSEVWNSTAAQEIRSSILDGSFKYCSQNDCPFINNGNLPDKVTITDPYMKDIIQNNKTLLNEGPRRIQLNHDNSCNLSCPSCRTEKITLKDGVEFDLLQKILDDSLNAEILKNINQLTITITGAGDPFASKLYRDFLTTFDGEKFTHIKIDLLTNGILLTPTMWEKISKIHRNIGHVRFSIDAMSETTYKVVRRGGIFSEAIKNLEFLAKKKGEGYFSHLCLCCVVQSHNYKEMKAIVEHAINLKTVSVHFQRIINWGTFTENEFNKLEIYSENHPEHGQFLEVLKDPIFKNPIVDMGNLTKYLPN